MSRAIGMCGELLHTPENAVRAWDSESSLFSQLVTSAGRLATSALTGTSLSASATAALPSAYTALQPTLRHRFLSCKELPHRAKFCPTIVRLDLLRRWNIPENSSRKAFHTWSSFHRQTLCMAITYPPPSPPPHFSFLRQTPRQPTSRAELPKGHRQRRRRPLQLPHPLRPR